MIDSLLPPSLTHANRRYWCAALCEFGLRAELFSHVATIRQGKHWDAYAICEEYHLEESGELPPGRTFLVANCKGEVYGVYVPDSAGEIGGKRARCTCTGFVTKGNCKHADTLTELIHTQGAI